MSETQDPGYGEVELPDLNLHRKGGHADDVPEPISGPNGQEAKKRTKDSANSGEEPDAEAGRSPKRPRLELENPHNEDEDVPPSLLSEKAKGKRPARSPELEEVLSKPDLDYVREESQPPDEPPQTQFDDREQSPTIEPLTAYTCPICFGVVTNATMTPW
jgi:hypothetical protein